MDDTRVNTENAEQKPEGHVLGLHYGWDSSSGVLLTNFLGCHKPSTDLYTVVLLWIDAGGLQNKHDLTLCFQKSNYKLKQMSIL